MITKETVEAALDQDRLLTKVSGSWFLCRRSGNTIEHEKGWMIPVRAKSKARRMISSQYPEDFGKLFLVMPTGGSGTLQETANEALKDSR